MFLVGVILNQYFNETKCALQIGDTNNLISIVNYPIYVFETEQNGNLNIDYKPSQRCQGFIISSDSPSSILEKLETYIQRKTEVRYNTRKYIFYQPNTGFNWMDYSKALHFISDTIFIKYLKTVNPNQNNEILPREENGYFELYTHKYVGLTNNNAPVLMDIWFPQNKSFLYNINLYPNKISNQFGRTLKVITADYLPYSHLESESGMELVSIIQYGVKYNVTLNITVTELWGKIYKNWTGFGIMGSVVMDKFDVGFSALFRQPNRILYSDFSSSTAFSQVSCVVPAPTEAEGWFTHLNVFSVLMWLLIISSFVSLGLTVYLAKALWSGRKFNTKYFTPLSLVGIFVSHPIPKTQIPSISRLRYVFALILVLNVMASTMYNSQLSSILVVPIFVNEIKTVEDLAKSSILWGELQDDWVIPLQVDDRPVYKIINDKFRVESEESLRELSLKNNFAFGTERLLSGYYAIGSYIKDDVVNKLVVMQEDLYRQYTCMQLRKNSVLLPSIDHFLLRATETGLLNYWEGQASMVQFDSNVQKALMFKTKDHSLVSLKVVHVKGVFLLWFIGLSISFIRFLHELEKGWIARRKLKAKLLATVTRTTPTIVMSTNTEVATPSVKTK